MSIENTWRAENELPDDDLSALLKPAGLSRLQSQHPLLKIRKSLRYNMIWGILICLLYIFVLLNFRIWQVQLCVLIVFLFSFWALYTAYLQYQNIQSAVSPVNPLLDELKRQYQSIHNWMTIQQRVALFIYPVSATGGFMLGGVLGSGKPVADFMSKPLIWTVLLIVLAVLVPACWFLARWMFNYSFGKHMKVLKENIEALEAEK